VTLRQTAKNYIEILKGISSSWYSTLPVKLCKD
jgi:hypothetical protein